MSQNKITGIIGGMGPQASLRLYQIIIEKAMVQYKAANNEDFPHFLLSNLPVPDTISNEQKKDQLISMLVEEVHRLKNAGCNKIVMACNTAHLFESFLQEASDGKFISLIDLVVNKIKSMEIPTVAVIGSPMTIKSGLYRDRLLAQGIETLNADDQNLDFYETIIRNHIAGKTTPEEIAALEKICNDYIDQGAVAIVLGCTELSSILGNNPVTEFCIDPLKILAETICENKVYSSSVSSVTGSLEPLKPVHTT